MGMLNDRFRLWKSCWEDLMTPTCPYCCIGQLPYHGATPCLLSSWWRVRSSQTYPRWRRNLLHNDLTLRSFDPATGSLSRNKNLTMPDATGCDHCQTFQTVQKSGWPQMEDSLLDKSLHLQMRQGRMLWRLRCNHAHLNIVPNTCSTDSDNRSTETIWRIEARSWPDHVLVRHCPSFKIWTNILRKEDVA